MYSTLQAAFGVWPSDKSYSADLGVGNPQPSGVNETFNFEDASPESTQPIFTLRPDSYPSEKVFVPPYFVPPDGPCGLPELDNAGAGASFQSDAAQQMNALSTTEHANGRGQESQASNSYPAPYETDPRNGSTTGHQGSTQELQVARNSQSPSPEPLSAELEKKREEMWSPESRQAFHDMVTAPGYVNRYRLHMKKKQRMMHYLQHPGLEPLLCDGSKDHQTKYQAANWMVRDGGLYRKPESGRVGRLRKHLDEFEAWDVLTTEHLRPTEYLPSGHLGRDKLRKVLERRYIGYTLQEIMFVLKECKRCSGKEKAAVADSASRNDSTADEMEVDDVNGEVANTGTTAPPTRTELESAASKGPFLRKQTSNMMWF